MSQQILSKIAESKPLANRLAKSVSLQDLDKAIQNLQAAARSLKREADKAMKVRAKKLKKLKSVIERLNLSVEDARSLIEGTGFTNQRRPRKPAAERTSNPRKGKKVAPKYQIQVGKETHKWTGRGRMPLVFKEFLEKGGSLDTCLIKKAK